MLQDETVVGVINILRGWKTKTQRMIGPFLIRESFLNRGLGVEAHVLTDQEIATWPECLSLRIACYVGSVGYVNARQFWTRLGYRAIGFRTTIAEQIPGIDVFEKPLLRKPLKQTSDQEADRR